MRQLSKERTYTRISDARRQEIDESHVKMGRLRRPPHLLKGNKGGEMPLHLHFVDVETLPRPLDDGVQLQELVYGVVCYWEREHGKNRDRKVWGTFTDIDTFWNQTLARIHPKERHYLIGHNIKADARVLEFERVLPDKGWTPEPPWDKGNVRIYRWRKGTRTLIILDNMNFCVATIEQIGEPFGIDKIDIPFDSRLYRTMAQTVKEGEEYLSTAQTDLWKRLKTRCHNDVLTMVTWWENWLTFLVQEDWGTFGITITKQAWNLFLHKYYTGNIMCHSRYRSTMLERASYKGGRADVQHIGKYTDGPYYDVDANAHYGSQMVRYEYPVRLLERQVNVPPGLCRSLLDSHCVVARVTVSIDVPTFPHKVAGFTAYPTGTFTTTLTTRELEFAYKRGTVHQVHEMCLYERYPLFKEAVQEIRSKELDAKARGDVVNSRLYKMARNGLYGKFGQRGVKQTKVKTLPRDTVPDERVWSAKDNGWVKFIEFAGTWYKQTTDLVSFNSFPAIAAHVTADGRLALWGWMETAGLDHVFVVDTDGLTVDQEGYNRLKHMVHPADMGMLKLEIKADSLWVKAPKWWGIGDQARHKGRPKHAQEVGKDTWGFWCTPSIDQQGKMGIADGWVQKWVTRTFTESVTGGRVTDTGQCIPWEIATIDGIEWIVNAPGYPRRNEKGALDTRDFHTLVGHPLSPLPVTPRPLIQAWEIRQEIETIRDARQVPHSVVFALWNYRKGTWNHGKDKHGNRIPLEYSAWDTRAADLGFPDLDHLQAAVLVQLGQDAKRKSLESQLRTL